MGEGPRAFLIPAVVVLQCYFAGAWSPVGHDRIARIAEHLLVGKHKDQIRTMMHSGLPDAAEFEATMTKQYPETSPLHWHRQDPEWTCDAKGGLGDKGHVRCDGHGATNGSLFCALAYFFEHFAHDALLKEFPAPKEPIGTPENLPSLKNIPAKEQTPAHYLKWLVMLVGDLHQPLHWLHEHGYGRDITIRYHGQPERTLLEFWEEYLPSHLLHKLEKGTAPFMIDKDYDQHAKSWGGKVPTELFREWAKEVAERVCSDVYAPMTVNHADGTRVDSPFTLTDELFGKWVSLAEELLQLSGERLGFILNEIIEHKRHKDAHKDGRGLPSRKVAVSVEKKASVQPTKKVASGDLAGGSGRSVPGSPDFDFGEWYKQIKIEERRRSRSAGAYNFFVAIVLVPLLLLAFRWHEQVGGGNLIRLAKIKM